MPFDGKKAKGFNLDCVLGNVAVTVVTCCGFVFQGTIEDEEHTRAQYGCPVVFPAMTMDFSKECKEEKEEKECKEEKKHCPKPIEVDVKCENEPKFICLRLSCVPGNICCDPEVAGNPSRVTPITGTGSPGATLDLFAVNDFILIDVKDIVAIGPFRGCLTAPIA